VKTSASFLIPALAALVLACGCASSYSWSPTVPRQLRTVSVPVFRNESNLTELGSKMTTQLLREFEREGTFELRQVGNAAVEIQGVVKGIRSTMTASDRRTGQRLSGYDVDATVEISVIDKTTSRVVVDNRKYTAHATYAAAQDLSTALRDASGRLAEDLARQVVDDVLNLKW